MIIQESLTNFYKSDALRRNPYWKRLQYEQYWSGAENLDNTCERLKI